MSATIKVQMTAQMGMESFTTRKRWKVTLKTCIFWFLPSYSVEIMYYMFKNSLWSFEVRDFVSNSCSKHHSWIVIQKIHCFDWGSVHEISYKRWDSYGGSQRDLSVWVIHWRGIPLSFIWMQPILYRRSLTLASQNLWVLLRLLCQGALCPGGTPFHAFYLEYLWMLRRFHFSPFKYLMFQIFLFGTRVMRTCISPIGCLV